MINLLIDNWIPVLRKDGSTDKISPIGLLSDSDDNPAVEINSVRPDFDGAIMQFLIGVYQVLLSPEEDEDCNEFFKTKPSVDSLKERIDLIAPAFVFDEGDHRFMQDPSADGSDEDRDINKLLLDNSSKPNMHFIKEGTIQHICPHCVAMALITLQLNSPVGGRGHWTSLRGGGPLTTLVCMSDDEKTLWKNIALNILSNEKFPTKEDTAVNPDDVSRIFPWLRDELPNSDVVPEILPGGDMHPYHVLFNLPRRIWIDFNDTVSGECDLCGAKSNSLVKTYRTYNHGMNYNNSFWHHPFTPYKYSDKEDEWSPVLCEESIGYNNWIGYVCSSPEDSLKPQPAKVVDKVSERFREISDLKINMFGYAMEKGKAKARVWTQATFPTIPIDDAYRKKFLKEVSYLIQTAEKIMAFTVTNIKLSYTKSAENKKSSINQGKFSDVRAAFWHQTEPLFYDTLPLLVKALIADNEKGDDEHSEVIECKKNWLRKLGIIVMQIFDERTTIPVNGGADPRSAAKAKLNMRYMFSDKNDIICDSLKIPCQKKIAGGKGKK